MTGMNLFALTLNTITVLLAVGVLSLLLVLATGVRRGRAKNQVAPPPFLLDSVCDLPPRTSERRMSDEDASSQRRRAA